GALRIGISVASRAKRSRAEAAGGGAGVDVPFPADAAGAPVDALPAAPAAPASSTTRTDADQIHPARRTRVHPGWLPSCSRSVPSSSRASTAPEGDPRRFSPPDADTTRSKPSRLVVWSEAVQTHPSRTASVQEPEV